MSILQYRNGSSILQTSCLTRTKARKYPHRHGVQMPNLRLLHSLRHTSSTPILAPHPRTQKKTKNSTNLCANRNMDKNRSRNHKRKTPSIRILVKQHHLRKKPTHPDSMAPTHTNHNNAARPNTRNPETKRR